MSVSPIPAGYHTATPYLVMKNAADAIEFYKKAFGAEEGMRLTGPGGSIGHAEIKIGDSPIMLADECPEMGFKGPETIGGTPVSICLYVEDADLVFDQAVVAGGEPIRPVADQFYGDRSGLLKDPFGHMWNIATHIEDVADDEMQKRFEAMMSQGMGGE